MRTESEYIKTSLYLKKDIKEKIQELAPEKSQTEFVNEAIEQMLADIERKIIKKELLKTLKSIKPVKRKETARQTLEKLRRERDKVLLGGGKKNKSKK